MTRSTSSHCTQSDSLTHSVALTHSLTHSTLTHSTLTHSLTQCEKACLDLGYLYHVRCLSHVSVHVARHMSGARTLQLLPCKTTQQHYIDVHRRSSSIDSSTAIRGSPPPPSRGPSTAQGHSSAAIKHSARSTSHEAMINVHQSPSTWKNRH